MAYKLLDLRQITFRGILAQIFPWISGQDGQTIISSVDQELTPPFSVTATSSASLVINVAPSIIANSVNNRNKSASFIGSLIPSLPVGGTVTFPSTSGSNITTSTGGSTVLTLTSGDYCAVLVSIDQSNNLITSVGVSAVSASAAVVPSPDANTAPICYVIVQNLAGTIQNITQSDIFQFAGGSGGGSSSGGAAAEVALTTGTVSVSVTYAQPRGDSNYVLICQMVNLIDTNPQFQPITIINKTATGFTAEWDAPLGSPNYSLDYVIAPGVSLQAGEFVVSSGTTSATISFPIAFLSTSYVVVAQLDNYTDTNPQFQPLTVTSKSLSQFVVSWNASLSSSNYRVSWMVGAYQ